MQSVQQKTKTETVTQTQSFTLVKNMFRAAFSSIAYVRRLFHDDCFHDAAIGGVQYQKINALSSTSGQEVQQFVDWLEEGVFDALQKKYLEVVMLEIYDNPSGRKGKSRSAEGPSADSLLTPKLIECFTLSVSYGKDGATFDLAKGAANATQTDTSTPMEPKVAIRQSTADVIRTLIELTGSLAPLPSSRIISMKLMYTPSTPEEYEPPLFCKANIEDMSWFVDSPLTKSVGNVTTPYHQVSMTVQATQTGWERKESDSTDVASEPHETRTKNKDPQKKVPPATASPNSTNSVHTTNKASKKQESAATKPQSGKKQKKADSSKTAKTGETKNVSKKAIGASVSTRSRGKTAGVSKMRKRSAQSGPSADAVRNGMGGGNKAWKLSPLKKRARPDNGESTAGRRLRKTSKGKSSLKQA